MIHSEGNLLRLLIGIDDTDSVGSKGTGSIASEMLEMIETKGWGKGGFVTRHQLYLHPDIPYTSHNSSMIFNAEISVGVYAEMLTQLEAYLEQESAEGSDPGLCVARVDEILERKELIAFGRLAKCTLLSKEQAYTQAARSNIYLTEKGGSGLGVIGALAGVALRLEGNDGEIKGGLKKFEQGQSYRVADLAAHKKIDRVLSIDMRPLPDEDLVNVTWKVKPVLLEGRPVLIVKSGDHEGEWRTMEKDSMRQFGDERSAIMGCEFFEPDVNEEQVYSTGITCLNCAFRRWTETSFTCMKKN